MIKFRLTYFLAVFALIFSTAGIDARVVKITAQADSVALTMGDTTAVRVQVIKEGHAGALVGLPEKEHDYHGMELYNIAVDSTDLGNGRTQLDYTLTFQAFDPAAAVVLPGFTYVVGTDTARSNVLTFKVLPVDLSPELGDVNNVDSLTIHPSEGPVQLRTRFYDYIPSWWYWVVIALAAAALAVVLYLLYKKNGPSLFVARKPVPPYELAMQRLVAIKRHGFIERGQFKEYYTELTDTLRSYLEGRFGIFAMEMTTKQILEQLRANEETHLSAAQIQTALEMADFVKFAAMKPLPDDNIKTYNTIYDFVESTKPVPTPEEEAQAAKTAKNKNQK